jgi:hypothetical protein
MEKNEWRVTSRALNEHIRTVAASKVVRDHFLFEVLPDLDG